MSVVTSGRTAVDRILLDTCTITRPAITTDPTTGQIAETPTTLRTGRCRVRPLQGFKMDIAGNRNDAYRYTVTVPWDWAGIAVGDVVAVTASEDPDLHGRTLTVTELPRTSTFAILRRLTCELEPT